jgi:predicted Zn-dependent protease with MMP-like domain
VATADLGHPLREQRRGDLTESAFRDGGASRSRCKNVSPGITVHDAARRGTRRHKTITGRRYAFGVTQDPESRRRPAKSRRGLRGWRPRRDRHGRGLRGRLVPASVPLARTRAEVFDDLVLDTVESLERRYSRELAGVEFAVEEVPPDLNVYDTDVLEDGEVPLARLLPGRPGRTNTPPRIVLYRRPLEFRAVDREDLADLVHDVIVEQVANLLGIDPDDLQTD